MQKKSGKTGTDNFSANNETHRLSYSAPQILSREKLESIAVDCQKDTTNVGACAPNINS